MFDERAETKVNQFNFVVFNQNIFQFDIPMYDVFGMAIVNSFNNLEKDILGLGFWDQLIWLLFKICS